MWHLLTFCDSGNLDTTCLLNHTYVFNDGDIITGNNLTIGDKGSIVNYTNGAIANHGAGITLNFVYIEINNGGNISGGSITVSATNLTVNTAGKIFTQGLGYTSGNGTGAGVNSGHASGAGHAGHGGHSYDGNGDVGGGIYGSSLKPFTFGSGGGAGDGGLGSAGSGIISIQISDTLNLSGGLISSAAIAPGGNGGGGSGGSIYINTNKIIGTGNLTASGGAGNGASGGGAGGRIAVYYNQSTFTGISASTVIGGPRGVTLGSNTAGGSGTMIFVDNTNNVAIIKDGFGFQNITGGIANESGTPNQTFWNTNNPTFWNFTNLTIYNSSVIQSVSMNIPITTNLQVTNISWTCSGNLIYLAINQTNLTIDSNSKIDLTACGYLPGNGTGAGVTVSTRAGGAGHASSGGINFNGDVSSRGSSYGSSLNPSTFGSGGASGEGNGTAGSGVILLQISDTLNLSGRLIVSESNTPGLNGAGGSGGSIYINTNKIIGTGNLTADGGSGVGVGAGGSGGRIAVYYNQSTFTGISASTATGGARGGTAGSNTAGGSGTLIFIDRLNNAVTIVSGFKFQNITGSIANESGTPNQTFWNTNNIGYYNFTNLTIINAFVSKNTSQPLTINVSGYFSAINSNITFNSYDVLNFTIRNTQYIANITNSNFTPNLNLEFYNSSAGKVLFKFNSTPNNFDPSAGQININTNNVSVNSDANVRLNRSATITLYNTASYGHNIVRNGAGCPTNICSIITSADTYVFNVTQFSDYSIGDLVAPNASLITPVNNTYAPQTFQTFGYLFNETYSSSSFGIFNNTNWSGNSIALNGTNLAGDFQSKVFAYASAQYWSIILGLNNTASGTRNLTIQTRTANSYNISDSGLVGLWGLNNGTGENATFFKDETGRNNGTCSGASCPTLNNSGVVGADYYFDGNNDYINLTEGQILNNFTYSFWIKTSKSYSGGFGYIYSNYGSNSYPQNLVAFLINTDNKAYMLFRDAEGDLINLNGIGPTLNDGIWHNIVGIKNATTALYYLDGIYGGSANNVATGSIDTSGSCDALAVYCVDYAGNPFQGAIDEVRIYNRSLNATEVQNLYNLGSYHISDWSDWSSENNLTNGIGTNTSITSKFMQFKTNFKTDTAGNSPNIFNSSVGISYIQSTQSSTQILSVNISDDVGIKNASLYINGVINQTVTYTAGTLTTTLGIIVTFADGIYNWLYNIFDFAGNSYNTANNTLTVDTIIPVPTFVSPTPTSGDGRGGIFEINVSITELNLMNVTLKFMNQADVVCNRSSTSLNNLFSCNNLNATVFNITETNYIFLFNKTGLLPGIIYDYNVSVLDFAGNTNITETRQVQGNTAPIITFNADTTQTGNYSAFDIIANVSVTDNENNFDTMKIYLYYNESLTGTIFSLINLTTTQVFNISLNYSNLSEGIYYLNATANDTIGVSSNSSTKRILLDRTNPNSTLVTPINGTILNNQTINLTANISENLGIKNVTLFVYNSSNYLINQTTLTGYAEGTLTILTGIVTNLVDGIYHWFYKIFDFAGNSYTTGNNTITIDIIIPNISGIVYSPNVNATLDPGAVVSFNATLVDLWAGTESVILEFYNGSWINYSMSRNSGDNLNGNYNTSVTLDSIDNNYTFNIWYDDSAGNSNKSVNQSFSANWDCTWTATPIDLGTAGGFNQEKTLGSIVFTNTGDVQYGTNNCSIKFARTVSGSIWYDGSSGYDTDGEFLNLSQSYYLKSGTKGLRYYIGADSVTSLIVNVSESKTLTVKGMFVRSTSLLTEYPSFPIFANITDTDSLVNNVTATAKMIVTPGAYLETAIEPSSQTVYLTPRTFNVAAYTKNVVDSSDNPQNNTAFNVTLNATLDATLTSLYTSGDLNKSFDKVNNTNKNYTNLTFTLTAANIVDLALTSHTVYSFTSGYENSSGNLTLIIHTNNQTIINSSGTVTFACYSVSDTICVNACINTTAGLVYDPDCALPTTTTTVTTTTGGGGGGGAGGGGSAIKSEATFELQRGGTQEFYLDIKNKYPGALKKMKISVSGINSEYILISPEKIESLAGYGTQKIKVKINAPAYFTGKKYTLTFLIESQLDTNGIMSPVTEKKVVTLYILEVSREESDVYINDTLDYIKTMNESGLNLKSITALLDSINKNYKDYNFIELKKAYDEAKQIYSDAIESKSVLDEMKINIADAERRGITTTETKKMLYIGQAAFNRGDYSLALERLKEAKLTFALETKGELNLAVTIKNNPLEAFGILLGAGLVSLGSALFVRFQLYKKKLRALKEEELLLLELMKIIQKECFERNHMSMEEYENAMAQYETRLSEAVEDRIKVETKLTNMLKFRGKRKALDEEKQRLVTNVKKMQDDYLNKGKIETRVYENMVKSYTRRLTEVEEQIATLEAEQAIKRERKVRTMFKVKE